MTTLAQAGGQSGSAHVGAITWAVILIIVILVAFALVVYLKHALLSSTSGTTDTQGLMDTMRAMRDRGELSPEEFDQARRALARKSVEEVEARLAAKAQAKTKVKGTMSAEAERLINAADESRNPQRPTPPDQHPKGR